MLRDAAAVATFSFCSRPTDGAAPLKPADAVRWMLAASLPPTPVHLCGFEQQNGGKGTEELLQRRSFVGVSQPQEQQSK